MKVGVDARLLSRPLTGIGRYTLEMSRALSKDSRVSLYLYSPSPLNPELMQIFESACIKTGGWNNCLLRQIWTESYLPLWVKKDGLDVFWGPAHRLPLWLPSTVSRVVTIHDLVWKYAGDTMRPLSRLLDRYQMPAAIRMADAVVANSRATADSIEKEFHININKLSVIHLGAIHLGAILSKNSKAFEELNGQRNCRPYFLFVGTLEPRKNLHRLLMAYSHLPDVLKDQSILVIAGGKGWGGVDIIDMVASLGIGKYVRILGYVDEATLSSLYANALFLAMPSLYEGFGLPLVEAMVHGTPVLTSNNSSMPEVAGDAGLLIDALDVESIKQGLEKLIINPNFRKALASRAVDNAARFNWDAAAVQLISVFESVISERVV